MLSSKIKYCDLEFGRCNKDLLEEVISYGISLGADFVEIFLEKKLNKKKIISSKELSHNHWVNFEERQKRFSTKILNKDLAVVRK